MKTTVHACWRKWWKYITTISLSVFILISSYLLGNTSFPLPDEIGLFQEINGWNSLWGNPKGNVPDSLLFINVCYDKELVDYKEDGIPVGKYVITDREKLLKLLSIAKAANNYRYIFLDVIFEKDIKSMEKIPIVASAGRPDDFGYLTDTYSSSWRTSASSTGSYIWIFLKKLDGTEFTEQELANEAAAVFTYAEPSA